MPVPPSIARVVAELFSKPPVIAVLGAHPTRHRAAWFVPDYLHARGCRILPVNPRYAGHTLHGETCVATLEEAAQHASLRGRLDAVVVFRASHALPDHLDALRAVRPHRVWFQQGIRHDAVAAALETAGIVVVQDRCLKVDHARVMGF